MTSTKEQEKPLYLPITYIATNLTAVDKWQAWSPVLPTLVSKTECNNPQCSKLADYKTLE